MGFQFSSIYKLIKVSGRIKLLRYFSSQQLINPSTIVIDVLVLGYVGAMPAEGIYLLVARIATAYYFIHFLVILPFLGTKEKTTPLPLSISDPVLGGVSPKMEMAKASNKLEDSSFEKIN